MAPTRLARWTDALVEFLVRLERDQPELTDRLGGAAGAMITRIRTGCSDPHHGGRTVFGFRTAAGAVVYYKPRDGGIEAACYRLMEELKSPDLPRPPAMVVAPDCCWVEGIDRLSSGVRDPVNRSRSAGALLALMDGLQAADLHPANLAGRDGRLMAIDLETVCHPTLPWENPGIRDPADPVSVLRVGLIGGAGWPGELDAGLLGEGFSAMYHRLKSEAVDRFLTGIAAQPGRVLLRATARYRAAWRGNRAAALADPAARRAALDRRLQKGTGAEPSAVPDSIRMLEVDALAEFDIPRFTARPDQIAVTCASSGRRVASICVSSGLARIAERRRVQGATDLTDRLTALSSGLALELVRTSLRPSGDRPA
jgi:lantibiotic modifying enzyme